MPTLWPLRSNKYSITNKCPRQTMTPVHSSVHRNQVAQKQETPPLYLQLQTHQSLLPPILIPNRLKCQ